MGLIQLCKCSIDKHNFCYNTFIGDGDSSSCKTVDKLRQYRLIMYSIERSKFVNHVSNCMETNLRALPCEYKGLYKPISH